MKRSTVSTNNFLDMLKLASRCLMTFSLSYAPLLGMEKNLDEAITQTVYEQAKNETSVSHIMQAIALGTDNFAALMHAEKNCEKLLEKIDDSRRWPKRVILKKELFLAAIVDHDALLEAIDLMKPFAASKKETSRFLHAPKHNKHLFVCKRRLKIDDETACLRFFILLEKLKNCINLESDAVMCSICHESLTERMKNQRANDKVNPDKQIVLNCNHRYHLACIISWLPRGGRCPFCRQIPTLSGSTQLGLENGLNSKEIAALATFLRCIEPVVKKGAPENRDISCVCHFIGTVKSSAFLQCYFVLCTTALIYFAFSGAHFLA